MVQESGKVSEPGPVTAVPGSEITFTHFHTGVCNFMFQFSLAPSGVAYLGAPYIGSDIASSGDEPSFDDLTYIQHYESLIAAEIDAVDAECNLIMALERFSTANKAVDGLRQAYADAA